MKVHCKIQKVQCRRITVEYCRLIHWKIILPSAILNKQQSLLSSGDRMIPDKEPMGGSDRQGHAEV